MLIALGSQSRVKQVALHSALSLLRATDVEIIAVKAHSHVDEQPMNGVTHQGAVNRAMHAATLVPAADITVAIESGIFRRDDRYLDIAVVLAYVPASHKFIEVESDSVEFPAHAVEECVRRGIDVWTVGKVLQEMSLVAQHDDPHLSLVGRSRSEYIRDAVLALFRKLQDDNLI